MLYGRVVPRKEAVEGLGEFTGTGLFLTPEQLDRVRLAMALPPTHQRPGEDPYSLVDAFARARGLPPVPGHWGVHLFSGEFLEP
jgi:hypothetical protein